MSTISTDVPANTEVGVDDAFDYRRIAKATIACPTCGGEDFETLCRTDRYLMGLNTARCRGCGLIMTNPAPTEASLSEFYAKHYRKYYRKLEKPDLSYIRRYALDRRADLTTQALLDAGLIGDGKNVLDVGCGEASIPRAIREACPESEVAGVEPYEPFARFAEEHSGCHIYRDLDDVPEDHRYDLVMLSHVLEHILQPVQFLRKLATFVKPGGRLFVDVPDVRGYRWLADLHIAHVYHFAPHTLAAAAEHAGLVPLSIEEHQPPKLPTCIRMVAAKEGEPVALGEDRAAEDAAAQLIGRMHRGARLFHFGFRMVMGTSECLWNLMSSEKTASGTTRPAG